MRQMPTYKERGATHIVDHYDGGYYATETSTDYLNKHASEWKPPLGSDLHLHLVYAHTVHWRVVTRASSVCKVPGRCHRVSVLPTTVLGIPVVWNSDFPTQYGDIGVYQAKREAFGG